MARKKDNTPRRKRTTREGRLARAKAWLPTYTGKNIVRGYSRWFGIDQLAAAIELQMLGVALPPGTIDQQKAAMLAKQHAAEKRRQHQEEQKTLLEEQRALEEWVSNLIWVHGDCYIYYKEEQRPQQPCS